MRPNSLLTSAVTAPAAAILIALLGSVFGGWDWGNPLGLVLYSVIFVLPFTLAGSFIVVLPTHIIATRVFDHPLSQASLVLITSAMAGAWMLQLFSGDASAAGLAGAASGVTTATVWLLLNSKTSQSQINA